MAYKMLGFLVWRSARWYMRRRYGRFVPSLPVLAGMAVVSGVGALAVAAAQRGSKT